MRGGKRGSLIARTIDFQAHKHRLILFTNAVHQHVEFMRTLAKKCAITSYRDINRACPIDYHMCQNRTADFPAVAVEYLARRAPRLFGYEAIYLIQQKLFTLSFGRLKELFRLRPPLVDQFPPLESVFAPPVDNNIRIFVAEIVQVIVQLLCQPADVDLSSLTQFMLQSPRSVRVCRRSSACCSSRTIR
jgi:hypothetical protein